jgi:hypothetical protein
MDAMTQTAIDWSAPGRDNETGEKGDPASGPALGDADGPLVPPGDDSQGAAARPGVLLPPDGVGQGGRLGIETFDNGQFDGQPTPADHGRRAERSVGDGLPDSTGHLLEQVHPLECDVGGEVGQDQLGRGDPLRICLVGDGHVGDEGPGERASQRLLEDLLPEREHRRPSVADEGQVQDRVRGQERGRRPEAHGERPELRRPLDKDREGVLEAAGVHVHRRHQGEVNGDPAVRPVTHRSPERIQLFVERRGDEQDDAQAGAGHPAIFVSVAPAREAQVPEAP